MTRRIRHQSTLLAQSSALFAWAVLLFCWDLATAARAEQAGGRVLPGVSVCPPTPSGTSTSVDRAKSNGKTGRPISSEYATAVVPHGRCTMPRSPRGNARKIFFGIAAPDERSTAAVTFFNPRAGDDDLCSGVVIADGALLTAGHCACGTNYQILFGSSINDPQQPPDRVGVFEMHRFPKYNCRQVEVGQPGVDYALLKFDPGQLANGTNTYEIAEIKSPAEVRKGFRTFPGINISVVSKNMRIVGYGRTERNTLGERLQAVVPVYSWFCSEPWAAALGCAPYSEIMLSQLGQWRI